MGANTVRKALNEWHRKKKAEKRPKRYTSITTGIGVVVLDAKREGQGILNVYGHTDTAVVKTILKALNREDRKRNTVTPGFKEI